jgi:putative oxidoreductase
MKKPIGKLLAGIDLLGLWLGLLGLRLILGWEYFESGLEKFRGENWFAEIQARFPFPFDAVPPDVSWQLATWFELVGGIALAIGLGTRFFGAALFVLTIVAIASVHWPAEWATLGELLQGYALTDRGQGNYKLPLIFMAMLLPLILSGPGRLSVDALIRRSMAR